MAAPTYQGLQVAGQAGTATLTIGAGLNLAADDIIVAGAMQSDTTAGTVADFGGTYNGSAWTEIIPDGDNSAPQLSLRWSRATGAHTGQTITLTRIGGSGSAIIAAYSIRGARTSGSPIGGAAGQWFTSEPTDWTPGISSEAVDALVLWGINDLGINDNDLSAWTMAGSAMTERQDSGTAVVIGLRLATLAQAIAGAVGTFDATFGYSTTTDRRFWAVTVESLGLVTAPEIFRPRRPMPMMRGPGKDMKAMGRLR